MEIIKYEDVFFIRDGRKILNNINWTVNRGENWAILGLNGSGKSSIINMLNAYESPTMGSLYVFGKRFGSYNWSNIKSRIGFVSNTLNRFINTLNSQKVENIVLSGKYSSIGLYKDIEETDIEKANELIRNFRLEHVKNNRYNTLSQGEQRLSLLSRAFMNSPDILVLDEPCSGLDIRARETLLSALEEQVKKTNSNIIYITHQIEEIAPFITHIALLYNGEIIDQGPKKEVLTEQNLSKVYCVNIELSWRNDRPWIVVV
ncbi:MAG: ATP-binding cassette domain-containing protein [Andreesenia angusta]|nr:ATP-binding cassette domain-containing protein [Andreesenia angusta]